MELSPNLPAIQIKKLLPRVASHHIGDPIMLDSKFTLDAGSKFFGF